MRIRHVLFGLMIVSLPLGCRTFRGDSHQGLTPSAQLSKATMKRSDKLPPTKAAELCRVTARLMEQKGNDRDAIALYQRARASDPEGSKAVCRRLAVLYDRVGAYEMALKEYEKAQKMFPKDPDLYNDMGYCHYVRGQWEKAEKYFRKALEHNATHERAWTNLGLTLGQQCRYSEALEAFRKVVPEAQAHCNLGFILTTQGKRQHAKAAYQQSLRLDPALQLAQFAYAKLENATDRAPSPAMPATAVAAKVEMPEEVIVVGGSEASEPGGWTIQRASGTSEEGGIKRASDPDCDLGNPKVKQADFGGWKGSRGTSK